MLGVASVDLSGPHEPTPMFGQQLGHRPGYYFVALTVEVGTITGYKHTETQADREGGADTARPEGAAPDGGDASAPPRPDGLDEDKVHEDKLPRMPLVYCEVVSQRMEAAEAAFDKSKAALELAIQEIAQRKLGRTQRRPS